MRSLASARSDAVLTLETHKRLQTSSDHDLHLVNDTFAIRLHSRYVPCHSCDRSNRGRFGCRLGRSGRIFQQDICVCRVSRWSAALRRPGGFAPNSARVKAASLNARSPLSLATALSMPSMLGSEVEGRAPFGVTAPFLAVVFAILRSTICASRRLASVTKRLALLAKSDAL